MSPPADAVQVVLYTDYNMGYGWVERVEHHVQGLTEGEVDLADTIGLARVLLFPEGAGTALGAALAQRIDAALAQHRPARATATWLSLLKRLRTLTHACREHPHAAVMARTVGR